MLYYFLLISQKYLKNGYLRNSFFNITISFHCYKKWNSFKNRRREVIFEFIKPPQVNELNLIQDSLTSTINLIKRKQKQINMLNKEIKYKRIEEQINNEYIENKIKSIQQKLEKEIYAEHAFWNRKQHIISLPYGDNFDKRNIPTKVRPIQMNQKYVNYCKKEIQEYLNNGLI